MFFTLYRHVFQGRSVKVTNVSSERVFKGVHTKSQHNWDIIYAMNYVISKKEIRKVEI
ncbi:hypothetical protein GCM10020331_087170 [Ectobacillus funiculus]